jgi:DNA-directed RNA polymerase subunit P
MPFFPANIEMKSSLMKTATYLNCGVYLLVEQVALLSVDEGQDTIYECAKCGATVRGKELELGIRCPHCRYRVLRKVRPPIVKRIHAR